MGANESTAAETMKEVLDFETRLANISIDEVSRYDTGQWYTKLSVGDLIREVPDFDWIKYLNNIGPSTFNETDMIVNYATPYLKELGQVLRDTDRRLIYNYMMWRVVMDLIPFLPPQYQV